MTRRQGDKVVRFIESQEHSLTVMNINDIMSELSFSLYIHRTTLECRHAPPP